MRKTADLLDFMPHRDLSNASEHWVLSYCHSSQIEGRIHELHLPVSHVEPKSATYSVFYFSLKQVGINVDSRYHIQSDPENPIKKQFSEKLGYNAPDSDSKILQKVKY